MLPKSVLSSPAADITVLKNPVALGAWLYSAHCVRCHGTYGQQRMAAEFDDDEELIMAFEQENCRIKWGRQYGGELRKKESKALVVFMNEFERNNSMPDLPELPPLPEDKPQIQPVKKKASLQLTEGPIERIDPQLERLLEINSIAHGAWLYTQNCYRCHLGYEKARSGQGFSRETISRTITNGKISTQMTPFSRMLGGNLTNKEIKDVVAYIMVFESYNETPALARIVTQPPKENPSALKPIGLPKFQPVTGDRTSGTVLYAKKCVQCHGPSGEGRLGRKLSGGFRVLRPDLMVKSIIKMGVPGSPMPSFSRNKGGDLSAKEIDDLVIRVLSF